MPVWRGLYGGFATRDYTHIRSCEGWSNGGGFITRGAEGDVRVFRLTDGEINDVRAAVAHARVALRLAAQEGQESVTCGYGVLDEVACGAYTPSKQLALLCGEVAEQYADMGFGATVLANVNVGEHDSEPDGPRIGQLVGVSLVVG